MNGNLTLQECAAILAALDTIEAQYNALKQMGQIPTEMNSIMRLLGAPDNFLEDTRQELLATGQEYLKTVRTAKAKITLLSAALEEAEEKAGKAALIAEAEKALAGTK